MVLLRTHLPDNLLTKVGLELEKDEMHYGHLWGKGTVHPKKKKVIRSASNDGV
jgi:hypothetical protein